MIGANEAVVGTGIAAALGVIGVRIAQEGGLPVEEDYRGPGKLHGKEVTGEVRELTLEASASNWALLRRGPSASGPENYVKPQTKTRGVEVYGDTYASGTIYGKVTPESDPKQVYGIWVKLEDELPVYKRDNQGNYSPRLDENGQHKKTTGFVSKTFVTYEEQQEST